jgi:DNA helicase-2/ATP-dependent DNA helicase PcrA
VEISDMGRGLTRKVVDEIEKLAETARRELPLRVLQNVLDKTGYLAALVKLPEQEKRESLQHLNGFADRLKRYEAATHGPSLRGFLEEFRLELESGEEGALDVDPDSGPELVKILTVHAAKGLEFKHVFVVSLVDQRFPTRARGEAIPLPDGLVQERLPEGDLHLEEERRLFYVALTRAKDSLTLSGATHYGGTRAKKPSAFLKEAGMEVPALTLELSDELKRLSLPDMDAVEEPLTKLYPLKRRFSFTQLAAFRKCPLQYKFAHVYRIPILGSHQKSFGQSVHLTFQKILELHKLRSGSVQTSLFGGADASGSGFISPGGFRVTEEEAKALYDECWIDEWYPDRAKHDEYRVEGLKAIKHFWKECAANAPDVLEIEKDFTLLLGQHSIKGKVDRVDRGAGKEGVRVFDYKTGRAKETLETEDKEQLWLYQVALEERGLTVERLAYVFVLDWKEVEVEPLKDKKREEFLEKLTKRMDDILASEFQPTPEPFTCKYCDFKNICEYKKV